MDSSASTAHTSQPPPAHSLHSLSHGVQALAALCSKTRQLLNAVVVIISTITPYDTITLHTKDHYDEVPLLPAPRPLSSPQVAMKRVAVGIWGCKACKKTVAGGAYVLQ